jgi:uncharacterized protein YndB with AHSA1/START domain
MTVAPVVVSVEVRAAPPRAFDLFTRRMGDWWVGGTPAPTPFAAIIVEPAAEGRWFERDAAGVETLWGKVVAFEPPSRLVLGWQLSSAFAYDPALLTEVEVTFTPTAAGGTLVRLEHRDLEQFGADGPRMAGLVEPGWTKQLVGYRDHADAEELAHG